MVQVGSVLYMVAAEDSAWVLAQLQFDAASCTFIETSRVRYGWPREAFGALLSRFAVGDVVDPWMIDRVTEDFTTWLGQHFVTA